jgi:uncharacterized protein
MGESLRFFKWSIGATVLALVVAFLYDGPSAAAIVAILIALEASISFDNAVVNATVLRRMSEFWQKMFLTVGFVIAVVGMRLVFPILIVTIATGIAVPDVIDQAINDKAAYAENVHKAAPIIGGFGGAFLLMVALGFLFDRDREVFWLGPLEQPLARLGRMRWLRILIAAAAVGVTALLATSDARSDILVAGAVGILANLAVRGLSKALEKRMGDADTAGGAAGFALFLYLELLDASFSLDGVLGAFAISTDLLVIALGLGVGALYIRSLTVYLVRNESLSQYRYLRHGAAWAILALAIVLLVTTSVQVPEWLTGTIGLVTIGAAFASSVRHNRREESAAAA